MIKQHSFWKSETNHRISKEVSDELGVSYDEVGKIIRHMFLCLKQELTNPNNLNKILLHHFGSFFTTEKRVWARIKFFVIKFKEGRMTLEEFKDKTDILYNQKREFKQIKKSKLKSKNAKSKI